ncbi:N-acetylmuramoyl-L-alanine amidase AmiD precursor [Thiorhodovibrio winogradskyi]|uniref:N-acetylmuramoyl-L-alanine amidase n=1 Tax=Thiorhodovibrio winogradskyi TaxID=77007 RepID=A0ABZ0S7C0_9GAMM|nr:peptidoglycan recognition family protein [Thiorhodovibrio winogradskyi]
MKIAVMKGIFPLLLFLGLAMPPVLALDDQVLVTGKPRPGGVRMIVLHATGGPDCIDSRSFRGGTLDGILGHFLRNRSRISIHYVIGRDGRVVSMVPESQVAWHVRGHNQDSIGIELVNDGDGVDPFPPAQIDRLVELLRGLLERHRLDGDAIKSHAELDDSTIVCKGVAIKRKQDPGAAFPWERVLAELRRDSGQDSGQDSAWN